MAGFLIIAALVVLGLVIGLTMLLAGLLQRSRAEGMPAWLAVPVAFVSAAIVVIGGGWAVLVGVCNGFGHR